MILFNGMLILSTCVEYVAHFEQVGIMEVQNAYYRGH